MNELISLVKLIGSNKINQIDLFDGRNNLPYKTRKLYDGILSDKITTEEDAITIIYNSTKDKPKYKKLESRLKKRLLNTLFFLDPNPTAFSELRKAKYTVAREFNLINILRERNDQQNTISLATKTYKKAKKYELTEYSLLIARVLYAHYSYTRPTKKVMLHISDEIEQLEKDLSAELLAESYYNQVSYIYVTKKSKFNPAELEKLKGFVDHLMKIKDKYNSFKFRLDTYNIITSYYILSDDFKNTILFCKEALTYFEGKPYQDNLAKFTFRTNIVLASIGNRNFELAEEYLNENLKLVTKGTLNWFYQCNYLQILYTTLGKFQELYSLVLDVVSMKNYKKFLLQNEYWNVIEAYVHFLIRMEKIDPELSASGKKLRPFSLTRFLNDVPKFSKDKRGLNISILIIQFLFLLVDRKYSKLIDRLDAIKQYSYRYLKNDESYRANLFIKMLLKAADADFHPIAAKRYTKEMHAKLLASNPSANFQSAEIEVIQYEKLWEIVMELLEKNKKKKTT